MSANKRQPAFGLATATPIAVSQRVEKMNVGRKNPPADADWDQNFMGYSRSLLAATNVKVTATKDAMTVAGTLVKLNSDSAGTGYFSEVRSNADARVHTLMNASGMNMERRACKVASVQSWKT